MTFSRVRSDNYTTLYILFIVLRVVFTTRELFESSDKTAWTS